VRPPGQPNPGSSRVTLGSHPGHPWVIPPGWTVHVAPRLPLGCPRGRPLGIPGAPSCQTPGWTVFVPPLRHPLVRPPGQPPLTLGSDPQDRLSLYHLQGTPRASPGQKPRTACPLVTPESPPGDPQNVPGSDPQDGLSLCHPQVAPRSLPGVECPCVAPGCP